MDEVDQITKLYSDGVPVEMIAQALDLSVAGVTASLFEKSSRFRREQARRPVDPSLPVADEMLGIITEIARGSDNDLTRLAAAKFVRDDLKGRRDAVSIDAGAQNNVLIFLQERMAIAAKKRSAFYELHDTSATTVVS